MVPLTSLLSQVLVAMTLEIDNEAEAAIDHRTRLGGGRGVWLVSWALAAGLLRRIPAEGVDRADVEDLAAISNVGGLQRWGYLTGGDGPLVPTAAGRHAAEVFAALQAEVDRRWAERFGPGLHAALRPVHDRLVVPPLDALPVLQHGLRADAVAGVRDRGDVLTTLPALLARVLLACTRQYEAGTRRSLTIGATALRVIGPDGRPTREVPAAAGVSPEATAWMHGALGRQRIAVVSGSHREKRVDLTERGRRALAGHVRLVAAVEAGCGEVGDLRRELEAALAAPALAEALTPYDGSWRLAGPYRRRTARLLADPRAGLPPHPVVLHRGGYPDGA